jgi:hypothetical protein
LGAGINETDCGPRSSNAAAAPIALHQRFDIGHLHLRGLSERINRRDGDSPRIAASEVKRRPWRDGNLPAIDEAYFVFLDAIGEYLNSGRSAPVGVDDRC